MPYSLHACSDQFLNFLCSVCAALRQTAHFARDHSKTAPLFTGSCGFHGSVQGQNIRLECNSVDDGNNVGNLGAAGVDALHRLNDFRDHLAALGRHSGCIDRQLVGRPCIFCIFLHRGTQLFHGSSCLLQRRSLLLRACRQIVVARGNLRAAGCHAFRILAHQAHGICQALLHLLHGTQQLAGFVIGLYRDVSGKIAAGDLIRNCNSTS